MQKRQINLICNLQFFNLLIHEIMIKKTATSQQNQLLLDAFVLHLKTLNYSLGTQRSAQSSCQFFLFWLAENNIILHETTSETIKTYFEKLAVQTNQNTGNGLANSYLDKIRSGLQIFYTFLRLTQEKKPAMPVFPIIKKASFKAVILTKEEVTILMKTCDETLLGKRNKALLVLYYGCGMRRQEATNLNVEDVDFERKTVFVSKSKSHQQRIIFMSEKTKNELEDYAFHVREKLIGKTQNEGAFLLTERGNRLSTPSASAIFNKTVLETKNVTIIGKKPSLHTLRHSIATHLLNAGMKLENIALFLGHRSLDSTQIYTHLMHENSTKSITEL